MRESKLKKGLVGLSYLITHPKRILHLGWLEKKYKETIGNQESFRHQHGKILYTFEDFLKKQKLASLNFKTKREEGSLSPFETFVLCRLIKATSSKTIFEIGTLKGKTTNNITRVLPKNGKIYTLDINQTLKRSKKIIPIKADSSKFDFSPHHNKIDLFFIDGMHYYEYVLSDLTNALKCVKKGGFIVSHDFDHFHLYTVNVILELCKFKGLKLFWIDGTRFAICKVNKK